MYDAASFLRSRCKADEYLVATRTNIAYYARLRPLEYQAVFGADEPIGGELSHRLRTSAVRWIAWIQGHSQIDFPNLEWLGRDESAPGLQLVYRNKYVSIWELLPEAAVSTDSHLNEHDRTTKQPASLSAWADR